MIVKCWKYIRHEYAKMRSQKLWCDGYGNASTFKWFHSGMTFALNRNSDEQPAALQLFNILFFHIRMIITLLVVPSTDGVGLVCCPFAHGDNESSQWKWRERESEKVRQRALQIGATQKTNNGVRPRKWGEIEYRNKFALMIVAVSLF